MAEEGNTRSHEPPDADPDAAWREAVDSARADIEADLRADAHEMFVAEAARIRLADRPGPGRVFLRCGHVLSGDILTSGGVDDAVVVAAAAGGRWLVPRAAVVRATGLGAGLRDEAVSSVARTLPSVLREAWAAGDSLLLLLCDGTRLAGHVTLVGADHLDASVDGERITVPYSAIDACRLDP